jgi:hypothetical protein
MSALDTSALIKAIEKYVKEYGRGGYANLARKSNVGNVKRWVTGEHAPSIDSWMRVHRAFPLDIPPPTLAGEGDPLSCEGAEDTSASSPARVNGGALDRDINELVGLLKAYGNKNIIEQTRAKLLRIKQIVEG